MQSPILTVENVADLIKCKKNEPSMSGVSQKNLPLVSHWDKLSLSRDGKKSFAIRLTLPIKNRIGVNLIIDFFIIVYSVMSRFIDTIIRYLLIKD